MSDADDRSQDSQQQRSQPFVGSEERPEVRLDPDMPIAEMRVRDLSTLLGQAVMSGPYKLIRAETFDFKLIKNEKFEKFEKFEKIEKFEHKHEKWEYVEVPVDRIPGPGPDPRIDQLIEAVSQLREEIAGLQRGGRGR